MKPSSYIEFVRKIKGKNWNPVQMHREFRKQVNKSDYAESDVDEILVNLMNLTKLAQKPLNKAK